MRPARLSLLILAALVVPCLGAQRTFDGVVTYTATGMGDQPVQLIFMVKGSRVRQEATMPGLPPEATGAAVLFDYARGSVTTLIPAQRKYTTSSFHSGSAPATPATATLAVRSTGRRETIAGMGCQVYEFGEEGKSGEACIATDQGHFIAVEGEAGMVAMGRGRAGSGDPRFAQFMRHFKDGALPLRFSIPGRGGRVMVFTATRVERKVLPDAVFQVPAGYTELRMP